MAISDGKTPAVDWDAAMDTVGGDEDLLLILIDTFFEETPKLMRDLRKAIDEQNFAEIQRNAHTVKGSLRVFGLTPNSSEQEWKDVCMAGGSFDLAPVTNGYEAALALELMGEHGQLIDHDEHYRGLQAVVAQVEEEFRARKGE
jgi:hypothetical protein